MNNKWKLVIAQLVLIVVTLSIISTPIVLYNNHIKGLKEPKAYAVEASIKDFISIREDDEPFIYNIEEQVVVGYKGANKYKVYKIKLTDTRGEVEMHLVSIEYKRDDAFIVRFFRTLTFAFGSRLKEKISREHIIKLKVENI